MHTQMTPRKAIRLLSASAARFSQTCSIEHKRSESRFSLIPNRDPERIFSKVIEPVIAVAEQFGQVGIGRDRVPKVLQSVPSALWS